MDLAAACETSCETVVTYCGDTDIMSNNKAAGAYKILILGKCGVGKTTLLWRFLHGEFNDRLDGDVLVDQERKEITMEDGTTVELEIWDTARLESYYTISPQYLRGAKGIIIVYQITDPSSYVELKDSWLKMVFTEFGEDADREVPILLVGSKSDLVNPRDKRQVLVRLKDVQEDLKTKYSYLLGPVECSSVTGKNVDKVFQEMAEEMVSRRDYGGQEKARHAAGIRIQPATITQSHCPC